ncbi:hypothetical protein [Shewanella sp.]|uniref:hypothetical protein n=1 Tax=Shewanella sp. TaxID=50422 RepID=UPI00356760FE
MAEAPPTRFKLNNFIIDCQNLTIDNGEKSVKLPVKVFEYLKLFLVNENHIVEHEEAIKNIWDGNEGVGKRGYINAMWQIRKAFTDLGGDCDAIFKTLPKVGYVLTVKPEPLPKSTAQNTGLKRQSIMLVALLSTTFILAVLYLFSSPPMRPESEPESESVKFATLQSITNFQGVEEHPAVSHDGNFLAFQWIQENKHGGLYIKDLRDSKSPLRLISSGEYRDTLPSWSPDDTALAYIQITSEGQCHIRVIQLLTLQDKLIDSDCWYVEFQKKLDWSADGNALLYSKLVNGVASLFKYDFITSQVTQVSFPESKSNDLMAIWAADSKNIIVLRERGQQYKLVLLSETGQEQLLLNYQESITGITRGKGNHQIFVNYSESGKIATYSLDFTNNNSPELTKINQISGASGLSFNTKTNELFVTKHQSSEYIVQRALDSERIIRRVFSSYRDLYGQYTSDNGSILFVSNRSANWDLWLQNEQGSTNLTKGVGMVRYASVSPDGKHFATTVLKKGDEQRLFIGDVREGQLSLIDTGNLTPEFPTWSADGSAVYFAAISNNLYGLYQFDINTARLTQLTSNNETFAIPDGKDALFVTRTDEKGIWRLNLKTKQFTKIIEDLAIEDFGSIFTQDGTLYYLTRTPQNDSIMKFNKGGEDEIIASYPANSIRKYFGIAKGDQDSFLLTLNSIYDADIYSFPVSY